MLNKDKILVIGAGGQIGVELVSALRLIDGADNVIASDLRMVDRFSVPGPFRVLDVMDRSALVSLVMGEQVTCIYHLAAFLSASGEKQPMRAWELNMAGLLNVLEVCRDFGCRLFWPSSIAVFGPDAPKIMCGQEVALNPSTVYGISKVSGEMWCRYYFERYGVDVRSLRYPGLISHSVPGGGGTTDYAVDIFREAAAGNHYLCYLKPDTVLPMMYMEDAVMATIRLMGAPSSSISVRTSYNVAALSFAPRKLAEVIASMVQGFSVEYEPDFRQVIAESWPDFIDDSLASKDWNWQPHFDLESMCKVMLDNLGVDVVAGSPVSSGFKGGIL
ncbi:MAG: NAD-dependent epimerase/dehydratase family protein [Chitinophagaceae bacterium]|nr:MAG: NAD-dependent epimerase/dehydratase family protein [Chitinophagaceae bacterium]